MLHATRNKQPVHDTLSELHVTLAPRLMLTACCTTKRGHNPVHCVACTGSHGVNVTLPEDDSPDGPSAQQPSTGHVINVTLPEDGSAAAGAPVPPPTNQGAGHGVNTSLPEDATSDAAGAPAPPPTNQGAGHGVNTALPEDATSNDSWIAGKCAARFDCSRHDSVRHLLFIRLHSRHTG